MQTTSCACKGVRSCTQCESTKGTYFTPNPSDVIFIYCDGCRQAVRMDIYESNSQCPHHTDIDNRNVSIPIDGIYLVPDFLSEDEENRLIQSIDNDIWIPSQSGRLKQDFGIKINFKKQTIKTKYFTGMPLYSLNLLERLHSHRLLKDFQSVELCNLDYNSTRGSHIDPHIDDIWIWGERLITINLLSDTILTLIPNADDSGKIIYIALPRRWLIVLYGDARYEYKHAIQRQHIHDRRLAVTFRELTGKNEKFAEENSDLYERILKIGKRFTGISVGRFDQIVNENQGSIKENVDNRSGELQTTHSMSKLFSFSSEEIQRIFSFCQVDGIILEKCSNTQTVVQIDPMHISSLGQFLARWRLATRSSPGETSSIDSSYWKEQYSRILEQKKSFYPFLLSNLFTCEEQLKSANVQLEIGRLWSNNQKNSYLFDLAAGLIERFSDEVIRDYEEILPLTSDEIDLIDCFVRLQLIENLLEETNSNEEKYLHYLEELSSNVFYFRNFVR